MCVCVMCIGEKFFGSLEIFYANPTNFGKSQVTWQDFGENSHYLDNNQFKLSKDSWKTDNFCLKGTNLAVFRQISTLSTFSLFKSSYFWPICMLLLYSFMFFWRKNSFCIQKHCFLFYTKLAIIFSF